MLKLYRNVKRGFYTNEALDWLVDNTTPFTFLEPLTQTMANLNATKFAGPTLASSPPLHKTASPGYVLTLVVCRS